MIIDSHIHLTAEQYENNLDELLQEAKDVGVEYFINVGAGFGSKTAADGVQLVKKYDNIYTAVGIHPTDAHNEYDFSQIESLASEPKVVALGETGLDYHWSTEHVEVQKIALKQHIDLAIRVKKPIIIHARGEEAANDSLSILKEKNAEEVGGVFHCYCEDADFAKKLAAMNFMVSFPGVLTFKNAKTVQAAARDIPISQIMIETDGPYLSPTPYRGKVCRPAYIVETAKMLAELKGLPTPECNQIVFDNTVRFYNLPL